MTDKKTGVRFGIDLGGTKTEIIALEASNGKELYRKRIPTARGDYDVTIKEIAALVTEAESVLNRKGTVGIGIPGSIERETGLIKNANAVWINHHPLDRDLGLALDRPIRVENDANCLAVSEATDGAGAGKSNVFAVIIGTGSGAGLVMNGKLVVGFNGIGGEWGHNPLPMPRVYMEPAEAERRTNMFDKNTGIEQGKTIYGQKSGVPEYFTDDIAWNEYPGDYCYCGRRNCQELWVSGTGFKNDYFRVNGEALSTHDIIANANKGEAKALACLDRYIDRMARSLSVVINLCDPDVIVLGGGMSNVAQLYERIPAIWDRYLFTGKCSTPLRQSMHGDSSGVRGAAWLWER